MASQAVFTDSKCFQIEYANVHNRMTDSICVHVHSKHVQTANLFSDMTQLQNYWLWQIWEGSCPIFHFSGILNTVSNTDILHLL
jgi:hypothetical protein